MAVKQEGGCGLHSCGAIMGCCECGNGTSGYVRCGEFLDLLSNCQCVRATLHGVRYILLPAMDVILMGLLLLLLYDMDVSCHRPFLPGTSLEPAVIPTAHTSSFTLQYFP